jgi:hypothetical protein
MLLIEMHYFWMQVTSNHFSQPRLRFYYSRKSKRPGQDGRCNRKTQKTAGTNVKNQVTLYLLKQSFDATNALRQDHVLDDALAAAGLPEGAKLFVLDGQPRPPWRKSYFRIEQPLSQMNKGALIFLPVDARERALCVDDLGRRRRKPTISTPDLPKMREAMETRQTFLQTIISKRARLKPSR